MFNVRPGQALRFGLLAFPLVAILGGEGQTARMTRAEYLRWSIGVPNPPAHVERLVAQFDRVLPRYGHVGYIDPDHAWVNPDATRQFFLTQYALVPRVLVENAVADHVIYFSHNEKPLAPDAIPKGMRLLLQVRLDLAVLTRDK